MVVGSTPFAYQRDKDIPSEERKQKLASSVSKGLTKKQEEAMDHLSGSCKDLIRGLLQPDSSKRIGLQKLHYHPWIIGGPDETLHFPSVHSAYYVYAKNLSLSRLSQILNITKEELNDRMANNTYDSVTAMYHLILDYIIDGDHTVGTHHCNNITMSLSSVLKEPNATTKDIQEDQSADINVDKEEENPLVRERSVPEQNSLDTSSFESLSILEKCANSETANRRAREERYMKELEAELEEDFGKSGDSVDLTGIWNFDEIETNSEKKNDDLNTETKEKSTGYINVCSNEQNRKNKIRNDILKQEADNTDDPRNVSLDEAKHYNNEDNMEEVKKLDNISATQSSPESGLCEHGTSMIIGYNLTSDDNILIDQHASRKKLSQTDTKLEEKACQVDIISTLQADVLQMSLPFNYKNDNEVKEKQSIISEQQETVAKQTQNVVCNNNISMSKLGSQEAEKTHHTIKVPSLSTSILVTLPQIGDGSCSPVNDEQTNTKNDRQTVESVASVEPCQLIPLPSNSDAHINHKLQSKRHRNNREPLLKITSYDINRQPNQIARKSSFTRILQSPRQVLSVPICNPVPKVDTKGSEGVVDGKIIYSETARRILTKTPSLPQDNLTPVSTMKSQSAKEKYSKEIKFTDRTSNIRPLRGLHVSESTEQIRSRHFIKNMSYQGLGMKSKEVINKGIQISPGRKNCRSRQERIFLTHASVSNLPKESRLLALNDVMKEAKPHCSEKLLKPKSTNLPKICDAFKAAMLNERNLSSFKPDSFFKDSNLKMPESSTEKKEVKWDKKLYERIRPDSGDQIRKNEKLTSLSLSKHFDSFRSLNSTFPECSQRNKIN